jgi:hypothetical protein
MAVMTSEIAGLVTRRVTLSGRILTIQITGSVFAWTVSG